MTNFDFIGVQINITDEWPSDRKSRAKLRQASDYIELTNDLKECAALANALKCDVSNYEFEMQHDVSTQIRKPGFLARAMESSLLSKYGRCFNSSSGRTSINKITVNNILDAGLIEHHEYLLARRDKVIAHAESIEGRQPIKVLNHSDEHTDWNFDLSSSIDFIPRFDDCMAKKTELCCMQIANHCVERASASFSNFLGDLNDSDVTQIRQGHWETDETGSSYPIFPPASKRS